MGFGQFLLCIICPPAWLLWAVYKLIHAFVKGYLVGLELRKMRERGIDRRSHQVFTDAKWGKHFQGVRTVIEAEQPKVTVIVEPEVCLLSERLEKIQQGWSK